MPSAAETTVSGPTVAQGIRGRRPVARRCGCAGGSVARWAQGRGAYRALVRARWEAAGGLPLVTQARPETSQPILERLGFRVACTLEVRREAL
jgi:hypothetical protein